MACGGDFEGEGEKDGERGHGEHSADAEEDDVAKASQRGVDGGQQGDHDGGASGESVDDADGEGSDAEYRSAEDEEAVVERFGTLVRFFGCV